MNLTKVIKAITPIVAIGAIFGIEVVALNNGIDGLLMGGAITVIAGLGGFIISRVKAKDGN